MPVPNPPKTISPSIMLTSGTVPPKAVKLSWAEMTAPVEVPVVEAANRPEAVGPKRTSLPSRLPPGWVAVTDWSTCDASRRSFPAASNPMARPAAAIHSRNMAAKTTHPCFWSFTIRP